MSKASDKFIREAEEKRNVTQSEFFCKSSYT